MSYYGDHDGKSQTSSAVDKEHYPEVDFEPSADGMKAVSRSEIARLAYQLWEERGRPDDAHEQDWLEAEKRLKEENEIPPDYRLLTEQQGSVQR
jgi:hypothetical protein